MDAIGAMISALRQRKVGVFPEGQAALLFLLLGVGSTLILATIQQSALNSVFLLGFVSIGGLVLCRSTQDSLNDSSLEILGYFWLIKLGITLFLLYAGWIPQLDPNLSISWGYDPQRYYFQAQELIDNNWIPDFISLNYVGILYYYGAIYYVLGHNPVIPALCNAFITLIATLYMIKVGYEVKGQRSPRDWTLAFALLMPELLWFDVMTSRETLMASLLVFAMLTTGRFLAQTSKISLFKVLMVVSLSGLAIAAVRASMLLPVFASIILMVLLITSKRISRFVKTILVMAIATILIAGPVITEYVSGYHLEIGKLIQTAFSAEGNIALSPDSEWSERSIGMLLMPEGLLQSLLFLPPRMVLYLVSPLPNIWVTISDLLAGSWLAWQYLFTLLSSVINLLAIPYVLASLVQAIRTRRSNSASLVFHISYWVTFMAVAGGNLIIHERYRIMATLLLLGCAWLGVGTCSKKMIIRMSLLWYGLLTFGALFYFGYKFILV